ncbi:MAG TPA: hypothetical protein VHO48_05485 [Anaerolineaceae bacterium]|nr:hypothetical protein [Anaerolineaceae bacterium]
MPGSLTDKLQLKAIKQLTVLNAPAEVAGRLAEALPGIEIAPEAAGKAEAVLLFVNNLAEVSALAPRAIEAAGVDGILWIAYPKGGSGVVTDVNRDKLWPVLDQMGWRPARQVAIDDVWSGMRFSRGKSGLAKA